VPATKPGNMSGGSAPVETHVSDNMQPPHVPFELSRKALDAWKKLDNKKMKLTQLLFSFQILVDQYHMLVMIQKHARDAERSELFQDHKNFWRFRLETLGDAVAVSEFTQAAIKDFEQVKYNASTLSLMKHAVENILQKQANEHKRVLATAARGINFRPTDVTVELLEARYQEPCDHPTLKQLIDTWREVLKMMGKDAIQRKYTIVETLQDIEHPLFVNAKQESFGKLVKQNAENSQLIETMKKTRNDEHKVFVMGSEIMFNNTMKNLSTAEINLTLPVRIQPTRKHFRGYAKFKWGGDSEEIASEDASELSAIEEEDDPNEGVHDSAGEDDYGHKHTLRPRPPDASRKDVEKGADAEDDVLLQDAMQVDGGNGSDAGNAKKRAHTEEDKPPNDEMQVDAGGMESTTDHHPGHDTDDDSEDGSEHGSGDDKKDDKKDDKNDHNEDGMEDISRKGVSEEPRHDEASGSASRQGNMYPIFFTKDQINRVLHHETVVAGTYNEVVHPELKIKDEKNKEHLLQKVRDRCNQANRDKNPAAFLKIGVSFTVVNNHRAKVVLRKRYEFYEDFPIQFVGEVSTNFQKHARSLLCYILSEQPIVVLTILKELKKLVNLDLETDVPFTKKTDTTAQVRPSKSKKSKTSASEDQHSELNTSRSIDKQKKMAAGILKHGQGNDGTPEVGEMVNVRVLIEYIDRLLDTVDYMVDLERPGPIDTVGKRENPLPPKMKIIHFATPQDEDLSEEDNKPPVEDTGLLIENATGNRALGSYPAVNEPENAILMGSIKIAHQSLMEIFAKPRGKSPEEDPPANSGKEQSKENPPLPAVIVKMEEDPPANSGKDQSNVKPALAPVRIKMEEDP